MRPARAAAQNTPAKPGRQPSFSQSDQTITPAARRLPVIDENDEFAQHSTQSRSDLHDPSIALATATSHQALSQSWDSPMVPTRTRRGHPVTPPRDARKEGSLMRPARAAAENTPAKPGQQPSFSQSATVPLEPEPRLASSTEVPRPRRSQRRSPGSQGPDNTQTQNPVARRTQSRSAPNIKVSGGTAFLAEMLRRHAEIQATWPETPVRTPVLPPRSAWSKEARAYIEACEGIGDQDVALAPRRCDMQAGVHDAVRDAVTVTSPGADIARERYSVQGAPLPQVAAAGSQARRTPT